MVECRMDGSDRMKSYFKKLSEEDKFARCFYACWMNHPGGFSKHKRENKRRARRRLKEELREERQEQEDE